MGFVGNYALCGLSPQTDGMPVIHKNRISGHDESNLLFLYSLLLLFLFIYFAELLRIPNTSVPAHAEIISNRIAMPTGVWSPVLV
mgnify:CR=1 FL=1